jgi:predicted sugar kinase
VKVFLPESSGPANYGLLYTRESKEIVDIEIGMYRSAGITGTITITLGANNYDGTVAQDDIV